MKLENHVYNAIQQLKQGETIGRRATPVISYWPMRPKWEKWGYAWESKGTDGDIVFEDGTSVIPAVLQLVYVRCSFGVCQLAYVLHEEVKGARGVIEAEQNYITARQTIPRTIEP